MFDKPKDAQSKISAVTTVSRFEIFIAGAILINMPSSQSGNKNKIDGHLNQRTVPNEQISTANSIALERFVLPATVTPRPNRM